MTAVIKIHSLIRPEQRRNNSTGSVENNDLKDYSGKLDIEYHINKTIPSKPDSMWPITILNTITLKTIPYKSSTGITRVSPTRFIYKIVSKWINYWSYPEYGLMNTVLYKFYPQPRINATYTLNQNWKIKAAYGIYYQFVKGWSGKIFFQGSLDFGSPWR